MIVRREMTRCPATWDVDLMLRADQCNFGLLDQIAGSVQCWYAGKYLPTHEVSVRTWLEIRMF